MTNKRTSYLILVSLVIIGIIMSFPVYGVDYDQETAINEVDGYMWQKMSYEAQKAFLLGFYGGQISVFGDSAERYGIKSISIIPETATWINDYYRRTGNLNKTMAEVISMERESNGAVNNNQQTQSQNTVVEYSGSGMKTTRPFTVNSSWEIQWEAHGMIFQVYLYSEDGQLVDVLANQQGEGKGSSYNPKIGSYYLEINAMGNWEVKIVKVDN